MATAAPVVTDPAPADVPVPEAVRAARDRVDRLTIRGRDLRLRPDDIVARGAADIQAWQRDVASLIADLSGGRKTHWLSREFSAALLVPVESGTDAPRTTMLDRLLQVLNRARQSLELSPAAAPDPTVSEDAGIRFAFVDDQDLRAHLERAYLDGRSAAERGDHALALVTLATVLDALITRCLERRASSLAADAPPPGEIGAWTFVERMAVAERAGAISAACARLPEQARDYRTLIDSSGEIRPDAVVTPARSAARESGPPHHPSRPRTRALSGAPPALTSVVVSGFSRTGTFLSVPCGPRFD